MTSFIDHRHQPEPRVYTGDGWTVINGRWEDSPPESVDVVISDPPYDDKTHVNARRSGSMYGGKAGGSAKAIVIPTLSFEPIKPANVGPPLVKIARRWVILFCAVEQLGEYKDACGDSYIRGGAWVKSNPKPQFSGDRPGQGFDGIAILHRPDREIDGVAILHRPGKKQWNRGGHCAVWRTQVPGRFGGESRHHETQKPLDLMLGLVSDFSKPRERVWDGFCGSGTTGVACRRLGREFVGHEMQPRILASKRLPDGQTAWLENPHDKPYARIAARRLAAETRCLTLRDDKRGQMSILDAIGEERP